MARGFSARVQDDALKIAAGKCGYCGGQLKPGQYEFDHRKPFALGGTSTIENVVVSCRACHVAKSQDEDNPAIRAADRKGKATKQLFVASGVPEIARRFR